MTAPAHPDKGLRITLLACMGLIAAFGLILAATPLHRGRGRWLFVLLMVAMGVLHRAVFTAVRRG